jgi:hypothetical protein
VLQAIAARGTIAPALDGRIVTSPR